MLIVWWYCGSLLVTNLVWCCGKSFVVLCLVGGVVLVLWFGVVFCGFFGLGLWWFSDLLCFL